MFISNSPSRSSLTKLIAKTKWRLLLPLFCWLCSTLPLLDIFRDLLGSMTNTSDTFWWKTMVCTGIQLLSRLLLRVFVKQHARRLSLRPEKSTPARPKNIPTILARLKDMLPMANNVYLRFLAGKGAASPTQPATQLPTLQNVAVCTRDVMDFEVHWYGYMNKGGFHALP